MEYFPADIIKLYTKYSRINLKSARVIYVSYCNSLRGCDQRVMGYSTAQMAK